MCSTGQLVWRRHFRGPPPSRQVVRATCVQLLPLVEMYCKWELEEDCTNLRSLLHRFDSESELESHELGRSLLSMIRDEDNGHDTLPHREPIVPTANPFDVIRQRLAAAALAIHELQPQVQLCSKFSLICELPYMFVFGLNTKLTFLSSAALHSVHIKYGWQTFWHPKQINLQLQCHE
jgi:hypothetical protein